MTVLERVFGSAACASLPVPEGKGDMAEKEGKVEFEGEVLESLGSGMHRVGLDNGHTTLAYTSGRMRRYRIRINPGDRVKVEVSPYDLARGRIVYRSK